jgi:hypothetical protein
MSINPYKNFQALEHFLKVKKSIFSIPKNRVTLSTCSFGFKPLSPVLSSAKYSSKAQYFGLDYDSLSLISCFRKSDSIRRIY